MIGGWAVRAIAGESHRRYTLDMDCAADPKNLPGIEKKLNSLGLKMESHEWGLLFYKDYVPHDDTPDEVKEKAKEIKLRIEVSPPIIKEMATHHYFEFGLENCITASIPYRGRPGAVAVKVPPVEDMAAVKIGLPVDYKNNFDSAVLLRISDIDDVVGSVLKNDDWKDIVLRRIPKLTGRARDKSRIENTLMLNAGISASAYVKQLTEIKRQLKTHI